MTVATAMVPAIAAGPTGLASQPVRIELQRALMFDPDLAAAKAALGELFARRK